MRWFVAVAGLFLVAGASFAQAPAGTEPVVSPDYTIGVEDVLHISVWGEKDLSVSVKVRPDGKITLPLVNDVQVRDLTPDQVRQLVATRLAGFIKDPNVSVAVEEINSFRVFVLGEVNKQGPVNFNRPTRLLQALAAAGGFTQYSKKRITLIREVGETETRVRVDYKRLVSAEGGQENVYLKPGDTLVVD
jgi:polysaccharide biosynthesis/export protein